MKKHFATLLLTGGAILCACQGLLSDKTSYTTQENEMNEIVFKVKTENTKTVTETTTSNLNSFYVSIAELTGGGSGLYGDFSSDVFTATKSGSVFMTDKYWPTSDPEYGFFCTNYDITGSNFDGALYSTSTRGQVMFFPSGLPSQDVVVATAQGYYGTTVPLTFRHIFARLGTMTVNTQSGYTLSVSSISAPCIPDGQYVFIPDYPGYEYNNNYGSVETFVSLEEWDYIDDGETPAPNPLGFTNKTLTRGSNDFLLLPGTYTISITYTLTKGDYSQTFTKTAEVTLEAGKINNITCTAVGGSAQEIQATVTVQAWNNNAITASLERPFNEHVFTINGQEVLLARSNLMYDAGVWKLQEYPWSVVESNGSVGTLTSDSQIGLFGWATSGYNGKNPWMTSTTDSDYYNTASIVDGSAKWGGISNNMDWAKNNTIYSFDGTALTGDIACLVMDDFIDDSYEYRSAWLTNHDDPSDEYPGSITCTINGHAGVMVFSDDYTDPCGNEKYNSGASFTEAQFKQMDKAGAVFLPSAGIRNGTTVTGVNSTCNYWSPYLGYTDGDYHIQFIQYGNLDYESKLAHYGLPVRLMKILD